MFILRMLVLKVRGCAALRPSHRWILSSFGKHTLSHACSQPYPRDSRRVGWGNHCCRRSALLGTGAADARKVPSAGGWPLFFPCAFVLSPLPRCAKGGTEEGLIPFETLCVSRLGPEGERGSRLPGAGWRQEHLLDRVQKLTENKLEGLLRP